jgi:hypothetical protein
MEAPVVVKPDIVSKKASVKEGMAPEIIKGSAPKREHRTQVRLTARNPSRRESSVGFGNRCLRRNANPNIPIIWKAKRK